MESFLAAAPGLMQTQGEVLGTALGETIQRAEQRRERAEAARARALSQREAAQAAFASSPQGVGLAGQAEASEPGVFGSICRVCREAPATIIDLPCHHYSVCPPCHVRTRDMALMGPADNQAAFPLNAPQGPKCLVCYAFLEAVDTINGTPTNTAH
jgi:hypothetical protein